MLKAQYKKDPGMSKPHRTSTMNPVTVLILCLSVPASIGQPEANVRSDTPIEKVLSSEAKGVELMGEVMKLFNYIQSIIAHRGSSVKPSVPEVNIQKPVEKPLTSPTQEKTPMDFSPREKKLIADFFELFRKMQNYSNLRNLPQTEKKTALVDFIKEYLRTVEEGSLAIRHSMVDAFIMFITSLANPII